MKSISLFYLGVVFLIAVIISTLNRNSESEQRHKYIPSGERKEEVKRCDLFSGRWVLDEVSYPLYEEAQCSFVTGVSACQGYGRKDVKYQHWAWKPHGCHLPRFNGKDLLNRIRGKRVTFVGDSLNRNQWTSMLCLLQSSLTSPKPWVRDGNLFVFHATEYNATIEFYWSPLLVESNCDDPANHGVSDRMLAIKSIEKHARHWTHSDILIFDSFMWWLQTPMTLIWGSFGSSDAIYKKVYMKHRLYEMALNTLSDWLDINIDRNKTTLFFMSLSPYHSGRIWEEIPHCFNQTELISEHRYRGVSPADWEWMNIAESAIGRLDERGLHVHYLNITNLSNYRLDAHPSIYKKFFRTITEEQRANPKSYADCVHWCLPGVPDAWNEILYSYIINL